MYVFFQNINNIHLLLLKKTFIWVQKSTIQFFICNSLLFDSDIIVRYHFPNISNRYISVIKLLIKIYLRHFDNYISQLKYITVKNICISLL